MLFVLTQQMTSSIQIPDDAVVFCRRIRPEQEIFGFKDDGIYEIIVSGGGMKEIRLGKYRYRERVLLILCKISQARCKERGHFMMPLS